MTLVLSRDTKTPWPGWRSGCVWAVHQPHFQNKRTVLLFILCEHLPSSILIKVNKSIRRPSNKHINRYKYGSQWGQTTKKINFAGEGVFLLMFCRLIRSQTDWLDVLNVTVRDDKCHLWIHSICTVALRRWDVPKQPSVVEEHRCKYNAAVLCSDVSLKRPVMHTSAFQQKHEEQFSTKRWPKSAHIGSHFIRGRRFWVTVNSNSKRWLALPPAKQARLSDLNHAPIAVFRPQNITAICIRERENRGERAAEGENRDDPMRGSECT